MRHPGFLLHGLIVLLLALQAGALEVRETVWGFDARVMPGRMNLVSVRLANPGRANFDEVLKLRESSGVGGSNGAPYVQPVFLSPGAERWVQFTVFIVSGYEQFALEWERGGRAQLLQPALGPPARVILSDAGSAFTASSQVRSFSDALFPTTVAAMDGLDALALDYVPRWEAARRTALVDWVRRGGLLLVLPGADGKVPQFTEQLSVLNGAGDSARVGAGRVVRVAVPRRELTEKTFVEAGGPAPEIKQPKAVTIYNLETTIFQRLATLTRPEIRWGLINWLSLLYVVLIGPGQFYLGRKIDYRVSIAAFLGCVAVFAGLFAVVGRRGSGEAQTVHSLSIARALEPGRHDVTQWLSAFVTRGAEYALTHRAPSNLYGTVSTEPINGALANGKDGRYFADIPLFSSRQFTHRAAMAGDDTRVTVERWEEADEKLTALVLKTAAGFPPETVEVRARFRDRFYLLQRNGPDLTLDAREQAEAYETFLPVAKVQAGMNQGGANPTETVEEKLRALLPLLYVRGLDGRGYLQNSIARGPQSAGELQLYVFAPSPENFSLQGEGFVREIGYTLYVQEVFKP